MFKSQTLELMGKISRHFSTKADKVIVLLKSIDKTLKEIKEFEETIKNVEEITGRD